MLFLGVNLLAVIVGSVPCMVQMSPPESTTYLLAPVASILIVLTESGILAGVGILTLFIAYVVFVWCALHRIGYRWLIPVALLMGSLAQGAFASWAMAGLAG